MLRSMMFLPSNSPSMLLNGTILQADSLIFDLEDAVAPEQKDAARYLLTQALMTLDYSHKVTVVRINDLESPYWQADLAAIVPLAPAFIMPTKVSGAAYIQRLDEQLAQLERQHGLNPEQIALIPLIETARGVEEAYAIAQASSRVKALFLGAEDLAADLRCPRSKEGAEIIYARGRLVMAARAAGVEAIDTPFTDTNDLSGLEKDCLLARSLGFSGKAVISPGHLSIVNSVFSPSPADILWAQDVLAALAEGKKLGKGAVALRGKMIDKPIVLRAEQYLAQARSLGLVSRQGVEEDKTNE